MRFEEQPPLPGPARWTLKPSWNLPGPHGSVCLWRLAGPSLDNSVHSSTVSPKLSTGGLYSCSFELFWTDLILLYWMARPTEYLKITTLPPAASFFLTRDHKASPSPCNLPFVTCLGLSVRKWSAPGVAWNGSRLFLWVPRVLSKAWVVTRPGVKTPVPWGLRLTPLWSRGLVRGKRLCKLLA